MRRLFFIFLALVGALTCATAQSPSSTDPSTAFAGYSLDIQQVDDVDVASGQQVSIDPRGFDVKVGVTHLGQAEARPSEGRLSSKDAQLLGDTVVRFKAVLPDQTEIPLSGAGTFMSTGVSYAHLFVDQQALGRFDALSNPEIWVVATLAPRSDSDPSLARALPSSRPVRLGLSIAALRPGQPELPYVYRKVGSLPLKPIFAAPVSMSSDDAYLAGQTPSVPGALGYYLWLRYQAQGSPIAHFASIAPPSANGWRTDLGFLKPNTTYRLSAFASPHNDTSTFAADGWRADAYAVSPEVVETIVPAGFHITPALIGILFASLFVIAAIMSLRNPHPAGSEIQRSVEDLNALPTHNRSGRTERAHRALAWILLAIATVTIVNYYEFFTTVVSAALRNEPIVGQDWNLQNSGGIALLIMSYSISLGICFEIGVYKLITLFRERRHYGLTAIPLASLWAFAVYLAGRSALAFIFHIGGFYATQPALRELGYLAGEAELVIFFCAIGGLMPMEHEGAPLPRAAGGPTIFDRVKSRLSSFRKPARPAVSPVAVVAMDTPGEPAQL